MRFSLLVGVLGIEPSLHEPESCVLPVYDTPSSQLVNLRDLLSKYTTVYRLLLSVQNETF